MSQPGLGPAIVLAAILALQVAPVAMAHEATFTEDGDHLFVVGMRLEPAVAGSVNQLDVIVRDNRTGGPVEDLEGSLEVTLLGPGGQQLAIDLSPQADLPGRYEASQPLVLTDPGPYRLAIQGTVDGTPVDLEIDLHSQVTQLVGEQVTAFPNASWEPPAQLAERVATLQEENQALDQEVDQLEERVTELEAQTEPSNGSPGPGAWATLIVVALVAGRASRDRR